MIFWLLINFLKRTLTQTKLRKNIIALTFVIGNEYVLNGSKMWITNSPIADVFVVWAKDEEGVIRGLVVERGMKGFSIGRKENKLGFRASDTAQLLFDNVRIPATHRLGSEGDGFKQALATLDGGRIGIAALSVGIAQACLEASIKYAKERSQFGRALGEFQAQ